MKKVSVALCFGCAVAASWALAGLGPETVDLKAAYEVEGKKSAVIFPHHQHQEKVKCGSCHKDVRGGGPLVVDLVNLTGSSNDFRKKSCGTCRVEMKVTKGKSCKTCHR